MLENRKIPPFPLVAGSPGRIRKTFGAEVIPEGVRIVANSCIERARAYAETMRPSPPAGA